MPAGSPLWLCTAEGVPVLEWASSTDQSGTYGLTHVSCRRVDFGPGTGHPSTLFRTLTRAIQIIADL